MKDLDSIIAQEVAELLGIANQNLYADIPSISARDEVFFLLRSLINRYRLM